MSSEFVRISHPEALYAEKNLLHSQLETLSSLKHIREYKSLRIKENQLKIKLKSALSEIFSLLKDLDKKLPEVKMPESPKEESSGSDLQTYENKPYTLEDELEKIRKKISSLRREQ